MNWKENLLVTIKFDKQMWHLNILILCIKNLSAENNIICFINNIFYFKIFFIITNKYNTTFITFLLIR
jgi:hypothetical protein